MRLFILRHGCAEPYHRARDAERALVSAGRTEVAGIIQRQLTQLGSPIIWASPYVRAQQSAAIAAERLALSHHRIITTDLLVPGARVPALAEALYQCDAKTVLLVSHQPLVSSLLDYFCGAAGTRHAMPTAALACVELAVAAAGLGDLRWLVTPEG